MGGATVVLLVYLVVCYRANSVCSVSLVSCDLGDRKRLPGKNEMPELFAAEVAFGCLM